MPLIRRTIRPVFTDDEIRQIEEEAARPPVDIVEPVLNDLLYRPIFSPNTTSSFVHTAPTTTALGAPVITRGGMRWIPPAVRLVIDTTRYTSVGITGAFKWPGNRNNFERQCLNQLNMHADERIRYVNYLIVANTTGTGKIREAIRGNRPIYSEMDFYQAIIDCSSAPVGMATTARTAMRSACDNQMLYEYIRRV